MKLLFELFPVIVFFIAYKLQGMYVATAAIMVATLLQVIWAKFRHGKVDKMLMIGFVLISVFGSATLLFHDESFIKWKPTVLYWLFGAILLFSKIFFHKNWIYIALHEKIAMPLPIWNKLNLVFSLFFVLLGLLNMYVAFNFSTDDWVNFKMFGTTGIMIVFMLAIGAWISKYIEEPKESN